MNLPEYREHGYDRPLQKQLATQMNVVLDYLYSQAAPAKVKEAAKAVCEELAAEKEISEEGE